MGSLEVVTDVAVKGLSYLVQHQIEHGACRNGVHHFCGQALGEHLSAFFGKHLSDSLMRAALLADDYNLECIHQQDSDNTG